MRSPAAGVSAAILLGCRDRVSSRTGDGTWFELSECQRGGFLFDGGWLQFGFGILLYYVLNYGSARDRLLATLGFGVIVVAAAAHWRELLDIQKNPYQEFVVASSSALTALYLPPLDRQLLSAGALQPIRTCGLMCYSLYLMHMPVVNLMRGGLRAAGIPTDASLESLFHYSACPRCG